VPATITTDRGTQITSAVWTSTCMGLGIKHMLTTAYHPQSNGVVEHTPADKRRLTCKWCMHGVALSSTLGSVRDTCVAQGGFSCVVNRAGKRITPHPPWLTAAHARSFPCQNASTTQAAGILRSRRRLPASSPARVEQVYLRLGASRSLWRPHMPAYTRWWPKGLKLSPSW
jgi:hypothetical protein